jgi:hypothetical protein
MWECKQHVIFIARCRRKTRYAELGRHLGEGIARAAQKSRIDQGLLMPDPVRMIISVGVALALGVQRDDDVRPGCLGLRAELATHTGR